MKVSSLYLLLCIFGTILSWVFIVAHVVASGLEPVVFLQSVFANHVATAVAVDLVASSAVFFVLLFQEGRRLGMTRLVAYVPATLLLGLVFGAGLFLYNRARLLERRAQQGVPADVARPAGERRG